MDMNTGSGTMHGTFQLDNVDGRWSVQYTGKIDDFYTRIKIIGHDSFAYEGFMVKSNYDGFLEDPLAICGYILETHAE